MKNFFQLPDAASLHPLVVKHFKRNFYANLLDACFWFFGDSFVAAYTIMPVFVSTLTDSPILIGMVPAMEAAGWFLPQLFLARTLEGREQRMPIVRTLGIFDRIPFLFLALGAFLIPALEKKNALIILLVMYAIKVLSSGLVALPWQELIATVIPVSHRGRYWGYSLILGKGTGLIGAAISGLILARIAYPVNYGVMFLIGFISVSISFTFLNLNIEPAIQRQAPSQSVRIWSKVKEILSRDRNFSYYLINRGFIFLTSMALGFTTVYAMKKFDLPIAQSATFSAIMMVSEIAGYSVWGVLGDNSGYKRVIEASNLLLIIGIANLLWIDTLWGLYIVFALISFAHSGEYIADQNFAMEFGSVEDRPTYIGMSKTLTGPFFLLAPIIGGVLVQTRGYNSMFLAALILAILAYLIIKFLVQDPRVSNRKPLK